MLKVGDKVRVKESCDVEPGRFGKVEKINPLGDVGVRLEGEGAPGGVIFYRQDELEPQHVL